LRLFDKNKSHCLNIEKFLYYSGRSRIARYINLDWGSKRKKTKVHIELGVLFVVRIN